MQVSKIICKMTDLIFVAMPVVISLCVLPHKVDFGEVLLNFIMAEVFWYFFIYPVTNNKTLSLTGELYKADNTLINNLARASYLIFGVLISLKCVLNIVGLVK